MWKSLHQDSWRIFTNARTDTKSTPDTKFADTALTNLNKGEMYRELLLDLDTWDFPWVSVAGYHLHFISDDWTFGGLWRSVIKEGMIELAVVTSWPTFSSPRSPVFIYKFNVDEMKKDIDKSDEVSN